jgi:hypothetical protein
MPSKLFIRTEPDVQTVVPSPDFVELCRLLLEGGQSYLVQAKGMAGVDPGLFVTLKLEVFGFFGELLASEYCDYRGPGQQFVLTAAATLPAEGGRTTRLPLGASANLSARVGIINPAAEVGLAAYNVVLIALSVDEIVTA